MREVAAITGGEVNVWAGTSGGLFSFNPSSGELTRYTTVEGLHGIDIQALAYDSTRKTVWIGYPDGVFERLEVETGQIETFRDIARTSRFTDRSIHMMEVIGDSLLVGTAFGLVVFDVAARETRDSYVRFGSTATSAAVHDVEMAPVTRDGEETPGYWLATERGIAYASRRHPNLRDPSAWTIEQLPSGPGEGRVTATAVEQFTGSIFVGSSVGGFVREETGHYAKVWQTVRQVRGLLTTPDYLVAVLPFTLRLIDRDGRTAVTDIGDYGDHRGLAIDASGNFWLGDGDRGIAGFGRMPFGGEVAEFSHTVIPEGPYHNLFSELVIDAGGALWAGSTGGPGTGFYRLKEGEWTNYIGRFFPELEGHNGFDRIDAVAPGNVWAGSAGDGLVHRSPDETLTRYDQSNSPLLPAPGSNNYTRVGGVSHGLDGVVWVTNLFASPSLMARLPDGTWHGVTDLADKAGISSVLFHRIFVDSHGQKWIDVRNSSDAGEGEGILIVDTGEGPADTSDDRARLIREGGFNAGLPHRTVTAITEDRSGRIWIGTEQGIAFVESPGFVLDTGRPVFPQWPTREGTILMNDVFVQDIAVNPADQKWLATANGAWLLNRSGTEVLRHLTTENSPLFSDNVVAVAVEPTHGTVYFATGQGLQSFVGEAVEPAETVEELHVYPNPVHVHGNSASSTVTIEGLMDAAQVRIISPDGRLVKRLAPGGGRVLWDVKNEDGELVSSGVYLVLAAGENNGTSAYGKVAVIR
jgi:ligand-binding sensor domain-containing protein